MDFKLFAMIRGIARIALIKKIYLCSGNEANRTSITFILKTVGIKMEYDMN